MDGRTLTLPHKNKPAVWKGKHQKIKETKLIKVKSGVRGGAKN